MLFGSQPAVGLDIGSSWVKVAQLRQSGQNIELEKLGVAPVHAASHDSGALREARIEAIKQAIETGGITARQVVTSVSGESIIPRYLQLPKMPEEELIGVLRLEAEEYVPYNIDDVYLDSDILGPAVSDGGAPKVDVLLVAARKDMIHDHAEMVRAAGIQPTMVDLDSFAFFNCFEVNYQPSPDEVYALLNIGATITSINIYAGGTSRFSRDIAIGGAQITEAIQNQLNIEFREAEELKAREGLPEIGQRPESSGESGESSALLDTIRGTVERITGEEMADDSPEAVAAEAARDVVGSLALEIQRSLQFFETQSLAKSADRVLIGGGTAKTRNIAEYLQAELGVPVETMDPLRRISPTGRSLSSAMVAEHRTALGVGVGLALRRLELK